MRPSLSELLVYPTLRHNTSKGRSSVRVLTNAESMLVLEEKAHRKGGARRERWKEKRARG